MKKIFSSLISILMLLGLTGISNAAVNSVTPSTNDINRTNGWAHVDQLSEGIGTTDLKFISTRAFYSCFEYRTDGDTNQKISNNNYNTLITDGLYPYYCQNNNNRTVTIPANEFVEVRMVFGAETDERFDWTRFDVLPADPDLDDDGVPNESDECSNTVSDIKEEDAWGVNRWHYVSGNLWTQQLNKNNKGGKTPYSMSYTFGCGCNQILDLLKDAGLGEFGGHYKFGCSTSILEDFHKDMSDGVLDGKYLIESINIPANKYTETVSVTNLVNGTSYSLEAIGTWNNSLNTTDAEYASKDSWVNYFDGYNISPWFLGNNEFDLMVDGSFIDWGPYNPTHKYSSLYTGTGSTVKFLIFDGDSTVLTPVVNPGWYGDNIGNLTVNIYGQL